MKERSISSFRDFSPKWVSHCRGCEVRLKSRVESTWHKGISAQGIAEAERGRRGKVKGERGRATETKRQRDIQAKL